MYVVKGRVGVVVEFAGKRIRIIGVASRIN
jgi:hypothetical protein